MDQVILYRCEQCDITRAMDKSGKDDNAPQCPECGEEMKEEI